MKTLIISLICTFGCLSLFAQTDSSNTNSTTRPATINNATSPTNSMNSSSDNSMKTNSRKNRKSKNNGSMNNNSMNNGSMNNNHSMDNGSMNMTSNAPATAHASLPVLETYISTDIVSVIKQKTAGGDQLYDITAVKAPGDTSMMNQNNTGNTTNSTNQNATTGNTTATTNMSSTNGNNQSMAMPQSWDYVVRLIRNGSMVTEKMDSTGNPINQ